jgi:hypothetical protein
VINAELFKLAHRFVRVPGVTSDPPHGGNPERYKAIEGVLIEPNPRGGVSIVGTCGRALAAFWDPLGYTPIAQVVKMQGINHTGVDKILKFKGPIMEVFDPIVGHPIDEVNIEYLNADDYGPWHLALSVEDDKSMTKDSSFYVRDLEKFMFAGDLGAVSVWSCKGAGKMEPHWVTHTHYSTFIGGLMPVKCPEDHMFRRPAWLPTK